MRTGDLSDSQLKSLLEKREIIKNKDDAPAFNAARFGDKQNSNGGYRHDGNVVELSCLILDYEHCSLPHIFQQWRGFRAFLYSTFSHSESDHRFRIVLPLEKPIPIEHFPNLWKWAQKRAGIGLDASKKNPSAIYYLPSSPPQKSLQKFEESSGEFLNWEKILKSKDPKGKSLDDLLAPHLQNLRSASMHDRNNQLNKSAFSLGKLIGSGFLDRSMAESALLQEAQAIGLENAEIQSTIKSGIDAGISECSNIKIMPKAPNQLGFAPFLDSNGNLKICIQNALFLLSSENIKFSKNEFSQEFLIDGNALQDEDLVRFSLLMEQKTKGRRWPEDLIDKSIKYLCSKSSFHPIKSEFEKVSWDEIPRIDAFFEDIFSIQDPEYPAIARAFFSQLIRRIYEPGSKADCVLLLIGPQGIGKSTFCKKLAIQEAWYRDAIVGNLGSKDACLALRGKWIIELSELAALRRSAMEKIKNYLSIDIDQYRLPYARNEIAQPRTCVFIGTTNEDLPLADHTGARRFWPIRLQSKPRLDLLEENLRQYYAEALKIYKSGQIFWHDPSRDLQESAYAQDSWEDILEEFLEGREITNILEISDLALKINSADLDRSAQTRIGICLHRLGWRRERIWKGKERGKNIYKKV